jgi:hypothetical protein
MHFLFSPSGKSEISPQSRSIGRAIGAERLRTLLFSPPLDNFLFAVVILRIESLASAAAPGLHRCRCAHAPSSIVLPIELLTRHERSCPWPPLPHTSSLCSYARSRILWRQCCRCREAAVLPAWVAAVRAAQGSAASMLFHALHGRPSSA